MVHQELSIAPDLTVAENVFLGKQPTNRFGIVRWRRMAREAREQLARLGIDVDPDAAARRSADRPAAADRDRPRAVFGRTHHHPRRADLRALAAGGRAPVRELAAAARRRQQHRLHLAFPRRHPARLRHGDGLPQRPQGAGHAAAAIEQGRADRGDDRQGPRGARGELHRRHRAAAAERSAGGAEGRGALARPRPTGTSRSRSTPARCWASTASWDAASSSWRGPCSASSRPDQRHGSIDGRRGTGLRAAPRRRGGPASPSCPRAGAPCCSTSSRSTRTSRSASSTASRSLLAQAVARAADRARAHVEQLQIRPAARRAQLGTLSGGNQQKVALAKWLTYPPKVLVLSEPTRGMDVGAKDDVIKIVRDLRDEGLPSSCSRPSPRRCCRSPTASSS